MSTLAWCDQAAQRAEALQAGLATDKEIRRFKVAINTACPLRCEYCFIDKDSGEVVSREAVEGLVRLMLSSPGQVKKLLIYGGEPFLKFELVREIARFARREASRAGKDLDLSICTSGVSLGREPLEFLAEQGFFLSVSIDGDEETHDSRRMLAGGAGTWRRIVRNLPLVFETMGRRRTMAIQCVHPDNVERMFENFQALVGLGFENVEIEVIHGFGWRDKGLLFGPMLRRVLDWIWAEALEGRRRFLDEFAPFLGRESHAECGDPECECHTSGEECARLKGRQGAT